ncbi:MAG: FecR domain-containing protein [Candidatus Methylacidiphilales bacterium]|nr:FecR family protein [Candidatus Methylacidiphilales bacterium]
MMSAFVRPSTLSSRLLAVMAVLMVVATSTTLLRAQSTLKTARVTLAEGTLTTGLLGKPATTPLTKGAVMTSDNYARTGAGSRAEFEFADGSLFRIGERTIFSFEGGGRTLRVDEGDGLLSIPKRQGQTTITTPALSAAVMGTTIYISIRPEGTTYACLEGKCKVGPHMMLPGHILTVSGAGRNYAGAPLRRFRIAEFVRTHGLFTRFRSRLPGAKLIEAEAKAQDSGAAAATTPAKPSPAPATTTPATSTLRERIIKRRSATP